MLDFPDHDFPTPKGNESITSLSILGHNISRRKLCIIWLSDVRTFTSVCLNFSVYFSIKPYFFLVYKIIFTKHPHQIIYYLLFYLNTQIYYFFLNFNSRLSSSSQISLILAFSMANLNKSLSLSLY